MGVQFPKSGWAGPRWPVEWIGTGDNNIETYIHPIMGNLPTTFEIARIMRHIEPTRA